MTSENNHIRAKINLSSSLQSLKTGIGILTSHSTHYRSFRHELPS